MVRVGVTMGDLSGIGPEITIKALKLFDGHAQFVAYAPPGTYPGIEGLEFVDLKGTNQALSAIEQSATDLRRGTIDAVVTAPVNKAVFEGRYPGHTELFEDILGADGVEHWWTTNESFDSETLSGNHSITFDARTRAIA